MRREQADAIVLAARFRIVDQQAHAHAAAGRAQHRAHQQLAAVVVLEDEILDVERALRAVRHLQPQRERVAAAREQRESGKAGMGFRAGVDLAAERRFLRVGERVDSTLGKFAPGCIVAQPASSATSITANQVATDFVRH